MGLNKREERTTVKDNAVSSGNGSWPPVGTETVHMESPGLPPQTVPAAGEGLDRLSEVLDGDSKPELAKANTGRKRGRPKKKPSSKLRAKRQKSEERVEGTPSGTPGADTAPHSRPDEGLGEQDPERIQLDLLANPDVAALLQKQSELFHSQLEAAIANREMLLSQIGALLTHDPADFLHFVAAWLPRMRTLMGLEPENIPETPSVDIAAVARTAAVAALTAVPAPTAPMPLPPQQFAYQPPMPQPAVQPGPVGNYPIRGYYNPSGGRR